VADVVRVFIEAGAPALAARLARDLHAAGWTVVPRADEADVVVRAADHRAPSLTAPAARDDAPIETLTPREHDVLALLAEGAGNRAIADRLGVSDHTVKFHLSAIFGKLGVTTRTAAVRRALRLGWIDT